MLLSAYDTIVAYHQATKHHLHRYARSAGYMDWANQPDPFRRYNGARQISLPMADKSEDIPFGSLFSSEVGSPQPLSFISLGAFLELSLGLSAWKVAGASRWSLRINPSSGNLHPTEGHLILPPMKGLSGGVFHYAPLQHGLEQRAALSANQWAELEDHFNGPGFLMALTTIFWREAWKYGERAYRYCNLDIGHALAAIAFAARLHHWRSTCLTGAGDDQIGTLLGFDRTRWQPLEKEIPEVLCWISVDSSAPPPAQFISDTLLTLIEAQAFDGRPMSLSRQPVDWPIIGQASRAAAKPPSAPPERVAEDIQAADAPQSWGQLSAVNIIRNRRSAVSFDPRKSIISIEKFRSMLELTLPRSATAPFGLAPTPPAVHLLLFVHRVTDLAPGLYLLTRVPGQQAALQGAWRSEFEWHQVWSGFPLWRLQEADLTLEAMEASCHQEIAGNSAFAVAMLAAFEPLLRPAPYLYRHMHWECGMIGQVLYLAAEACGLRGTGIGCFFDDVVHRLLGIEDLTHQNLYHFTVGHPVEDARLDTLPAYQHLDR